MSSPDPDLSAVLLAGGASRRMGRPKPFLEVGGRKVAARLLDEAARVAGDLLLSVGDADPFRRRLPEWGWEPDPDAAGDEETFRRHGAMLRIVPDRRLGLGPLAGIEAAASAAVGERCLLLAADLPFASAPLLRTLLAEMDRWEEGDAGAGARPRIVLPVVDGRRQPLCSVFDRRAGRIAAACLDQDLRSVAAWTDRLAVREVSAARRQLFDLDTPEDLRRARRWSGTSATTTADRGGEDV